jgi:hypothetical protein
MIGAINEIDECILENCSLAKNQICLLIAESSVDQELLATSLISTAGYSVRGALHIREYPYTPQHFLRPTTVIYT